MYTCEENDIYRQCPLCYLKKHPIFILMLNQAEY